MKIYVFRKVTRVHMCVGFLCVSAYRHTFNKDCYSVSILFQLPLGMDASTTTVRPAPICYGEPRSPLPVRPSLLCYEHFLTQSLPCKPAPLRNDNPKNLLPRRPSLLCYENSLTWSLPRKPAPLCPGKSSNSKGPSASKQLYPDLSKETKKNSHSDSLSAPDEEEARQKQVRQT